MTFQGRFRHLLPPLLLGFVLLALLAAAPAQPATAIGQAQARQLAEGARLYELNCTVCHGDTGGGLDEARLAFPEDHRRCESCHKPGNPDRQADMQNSFELMRGRVAVGNAFAIGSAPPLEGNGALSAFREASALSAYIRSAMPRYAPGKLSEKDSLALSALILKWNRALPEDAVLTRENALDYKF